MFLGRSGGPDPEADAREVETARRLARSSHVDGYRRHDDDGFIEAEGEHNALRAPMEVKDRMTRCCIQT
jgi:hypothetical protein